MKEWTRPDDKADVCAPDDGLTSRRVGERTEARQSWGWSSSSPKLDVAWNRTQTGSILTVPLCDDIFPENDEFWRQQMNETSGTEWSKVWWGWFG